MKHLRTTYTFCLLAMAFLECYSCKAPDQTSGKETPAVKDTSEVYTVEIKEMKFVPDSITVQAGDKIVFVNRDMVTHDVTELPNKAWTSGPIVNGNFWTLTATQSADYYCSIHQVMKGKIIVE